MALAAASLSNPALAQQSPASADAANVAEEAPSDQGDIVVTARKKSEDILKTPIAITAYTGADLTARGIVTVADLANFTPGMKIVGTSSGRNDRSFQQIIIRGFTPSVATLPTTSVFIDGVPVSTSTAIQNIDDPARIEVLKGPQSAYFGRQTFAGAVNVVTRDPSTELSGSVDASLSTRNGHDVKLALSGPLLKDDVLGFRATYRDWAKGGSYSNGGNRGEMLGDQVTKSASLALVFKPTPNFTAKAFGMYSKNNDGPNATGIISAYQVNAGNPATGAVILADQSNCSFTGINPRSTTANPLPAPTNRYICGTLPGLSGLSPSMNTAITPTVQNFLNSPNGRLINPSDGVQGYGLKSRFYHLHLSMNWDLGNGISVSSLTGYNNEFKSQLSDLDLTYDTSTPPTSTAAGANAYYDYPYMVEYVNRDISQEFRANFDNKGPFRASVGLSYLNGFFQSGGGGRPDIPVSIVSGATRNRTYGAFFGLAYDLTSKLTINVDGRYQIDDLIAYTRPAGLTLASDAFAPAGTYAGGSKLVEKKYRNFVPRAIVNYQITPQTLVYASFSKGINPGLFTTVFLSQPAATQAAAAAAGFKIAVEPEKLDNYEIGIKGKLWDNHIRYALSAYYAIWSNQINQLNIIETVNGVPTTLSGYSNSGRVRMSGIEADTSFYPTSRLTFNATGSINDSYILQLAAPTVSQLTGVTNFRGKENPLTSKYSASVGAAYEMPLNAYDDAKAFLRADFAYKSGIYTNASNFTKTPDLTQVNAHIGVKNNSITIEGFVTNLFNNKAYASAIDYTALDRSNAHRTYNSAVAVALRDLRMFGVRGRYEF
jgi:iron complex outermembrane receptor protein